MKQEKVCHLCDERFEGRSVWYIPACDRYIDVCESCVESYVKEITDEASAHEASISLYCKHLK